MWDSLPDKQLHSGAVSLRTIPKWSSLLGEQYQWEQSPLRTIPQRDSLSENNPRVEVSPKEQSQWNSLPKEQSHSGTVSLKNNPTVGQSP